MKIDLAMNFARVTEVAALAGHKWLGRGDKNAADEAAVEAMRHVLNHADISGEIVIGEGEIDDAPMLYIGERLGTGSEPIDIAVDPIEGTRMTAMGQLNAVSVLAAAKKGSFLKAPDMYMEKLAVGPSLKGIIDLNKSIEDNLRAAAKALNKPLNEVTVITLAKPRHDDIILKMQSMGIRVFAVPDGDVAASILTCLPECDIDILYCTGGAPEGVISAAALRALGGDMQARLLLRSDVKGSGKENLLHSQKEQQRCEEMGVTPNTVLRLDDLVSSDDIVFSATGITKGDLVEGVKRNGNLATTETLLIHGRCGTIQRIKSTHDLCKVDAEIKDIVL